MSSKFKSLMEQARNREEAPIEQMEEPADSTPAGPASPDSTLAAGEAAANASPALLDSDASSAGGASIFGAASDGDDVPHTRSASRAPRGGRPSPTRPGGRRDTRDTGEILPGNGGRGLPAEAQYHAAEDAGAPRRGRPPGKRSNPDFEQITAYISKKTHVEVKIALLQEGQRREFSELVQELLTEWLNARS